MSKSSNSVLPVLALAGCAGIIAYVAMRPKTPAQNNNNSGNGSGSTPTHYPATAPPPASTQGWQQTANGYVNQFNQLVATGTAAWQQLQNLFGGRGNANSFRPSGSNVG